MPALQVVDAMLAMLGNKHTTATHQVLFRCRDSFLLSHIGLGLGILVSPWVNHRHPPEERNRTCQPTNVRGGSPDYCPMCKCSPLGAEN